MLVYVFNNPRIYEDCVFEVRDVTSEGSLHQALLHDQLDLLSNQTMRVTYHSRILSNSGLHFRW